jgi:hypothetical protein
MTSLATSTHLPAFIEPRKRDAIGHELETTPDDLGGQAPPVTAASEITPVAPTPIEHHALAPEVTHRIPKVSERARTRTDRLGDIDAASPDVVIEAVRKLDEQQWMPRAQLVGRA